MKRGDLVHVKFKDHCFTSGGVTPPLHCELVGYITHIDDEAVVVAPWVVSGDLDEGNNDTYTLLRHKGMKITKLKLA